MVINKIYFIVVYFRVGRKIYTKMSIMIIIIIMVKRLFMPFIFLVSFIISIVIRTADVVVVVVAAN